MTEHEIIRVGLAFDDYFLLGLSIAGSIFAGIISSFLVSRKIKNDDTKNIIKNMKNAIKQEIQENIDGLKDEDMTTSMDNDGFYKSEIKYLSMASFDSSVKSGNFILLDRELRELISDLYLFIHLGNFHADQLIHSQFIISYDDEKFEKIILTQLKALKEIHEKITTKSNSLLKKLD